MHIHFEGELTTRDAKRHIPHRFEMPGGMDILDITFRFAPVLVHGAKNLLTLTLFDARGETAAGFRGAGHRDGDPEPQGNACVDRVHVSATTATPGYISGPLLAGIWTVEIDTHMIMPGAPLHYTLDVTAAETAEAPETAVPEPDVRGVAHETGGPGWYRGDLHTHTRHSDAHGFAVADLVRSAADAGLDFVFLTDHNTTSGLRSAPVGGMSRPVLCAGLELTTYWGHALCLGARDWVDWRVAPGSGAMARIRRDVDAAGGVFVIAHPGSVGDPQCTGCAWRFGELMPGDAGFVEVWNGPWAGDSGNEAALALWYDWLNQGYHLTATAGTDTHGAGGYTANGSEGRPGFSVIYAAALSERALLDGLRAGRCYLTAGPNLSLRADGAGDARWQMGDTIHGPATLTLAWENCPAGARGRLLANGRLLDVWVCEGDGQRAWPVTPDTGDWLVAEIRDAAGSMVAVTNPMWVGDRGQKLETRVQ